jgi:hypothetical protein
MKKIIRIIKTEYNNNIEYRAYFNIDGKNIYLNSKEELSDSEWLNLAPDTIPDDIVEEPEPEPIEWSEINESLVDDKDNLKTNFVTYIFTHPNCSYEECLISVGGQAQLVQAAALLNVYIGVCIQKQFIAEPTFTAMRDWMLTKTPQELMVL